MNVQFDRTFTYVSWVNTAATWYVLRATPGGDAAEKLAGPFPTREIGEMTRRVLQSAGVF